MPSTSRNLLLAFYGDDFTGSTDAMESLALAGVRTVLFTDPPSPATLARYPGLRAFGVAGMTRAMSPHDMDQTLRPALTAIKATGAPIVHYKVCSTFDSSPTTGSIGRAIDVGADVFNSSFVPVVPAAPALGRYCAFGNLFARCGSESDPYRLDRHPSMSRHPVTPMDEADLTRHLAKQTDRKISLFDLLSLESPDADARFDRFAAATPVGLIDALYDRHLATVGRLLDRCPKPLFVAGSSGVESALTAHWRLPPASFPPIPKVEQILVLSGSRSPVTARQIQAAEAAGFDSIPFDSANPARRATESLRAGRSAILHTYRSDPRDPIGPTLGALAAEVLAATPVRRLVIAGGDTSGQIARHLAIQSLELLAPLARGAPLGRATAPGSPADQIEVTFKGGQIGPESFFLQVAHGTPSPQ